MRSIKTWPSKWADLACLSSVSVGTVGIGHRTQTNSLRRWHRISSGASRALASTDACSRAISRRIRYHFRILRSGMPSSVLPGISRRPNEQPCFTIPPPEYTGWHIERIPGRVVMERPADEESAGLCRYKAYPIYHPFHGGHQTPIGDRGGCRGVVGVMPPRRQACLWRSTLPSTSGARSPERKQEMWSRELHR